MAEIASSNRDHNDDEDDEPAQKRSSMRVKTVRQIKNQRVNRKNQNEYGWLIAIWTTTVVGEGALYRLENPYAYTHGYDE